MVDAYDIDGCPLITGIAIAFSPNWWVFTVLRFFHGYAAISLYIIAFIVGKILKAGSTPKNNTNTN